MELNLLAPKDAAKEMGISVPTITRCVKRGAPVHRWGSTGHRYRIDVSEFTKWMENQNPNKKADSVRDSCLITTADQLAARRRDAVRAL